MVRIPAVTEQQVQREVTQQPMAQNAPAAAFSNPLGQAVATGVQTFADIDQRAALAEAETIDLDLDRQYRDMLHGENGYFRTSNKVAHDAAPEVKKNIQKMRDEALGRITNPAAREAFAKVSQNKIDRTGADITNHAVKNLESWERANLMAQVENSLENASLYFTDPKALESERWKGEQAILDDAAKTDMGAEELREKTETYNSSFNSAAIEGAINNGLIDKAESLLAAKRSTLEGPTASLLEAKISKYKEAQSVQKEASMVNAIATNAVTQFGDAGNARQLITEAINKLPPGEERGKALKEAYSMLDQKVKGDKEAIGAEFTNAEKMIAGGVPLNAWLTENGDTWKRMSTEQQDALRSGAVASTDQVAWSNLQLMGDDQLAKTTPSDYFTKLAPADRQKLTDLVKSAKEGKTNSLARTRAQFTDNMITQVFGNKKDWNNNQYSAVNNFYSAVEAQLSVLAPEGSGKSITDEQYKEVVKGMTREVVKKNRLFDTTIGAQDVFDNDTIPQEQRDKVIEYLANKGIPITSDNIYRAYKKATQ